MAQKERDYSNLKETERVWDAVKMHGTEVKDYALEHSVSTMWNLNEEQMLNRLVHIFIGRDRWVGRSTDLWKAINEMVADADDNGVLPRGVCRIPGKTGLLTINSLAVNQECLRDHVAEVSINGNKAIIDLEELMKATRYA